MSSALSVKKNCLSFCPSFFDFSELLSPSCFLSDEMADFELAASVWMNTARNNRWFKFLCFTARFVCLVSGCLENHSLLHFKNWWFNDVRYSSFSFPNRKTTELNPLNAHLVLQNWPLLADVPSNHLTSKFHSWRWRTAYVQEEEPLNWMQTKKYKTKSI